MKQFVTTSVVWLAMGVAQPAGAADAISKDIAARIEAIPIQTLTILDEQFLKGDACGKRDMRGAAAFAAAGDGCIRGRAGNHGA